jgi:AcrR family transcriptional regulator
MRITADEKEATRERILAAAVSQFRESGFSAATTRDIAREAKIATGTLFNYFPSKEAIVLALAVEALAEADKDFERAKRSGASLEEELFALIAAGLRQLKRHRDYLGPLVQAALSPLVVGTGLDDVAAVREQHLSRVQGILSEHGLPERSSVALQLYWTLYLGILAYWISDRSPKQEDTRALSDQSVSMFCEWVRRDDGEP